MEAIETFCLPRPALSAGHGRRPLDRATAVRLRAVPAFGARREAVERDAEAGSVSLPDQDGEHHQIDPLQHRCASRCPQGRPRGLDGSAGVGEPAALHLQDGEVEPGHPGPPGREGLGDCERLAVGLGRLLPQATPAGHLPREVEGVEQGAPRPAAVVLAPGEGDPLPRAAQRGFRVGGRRGDRQIHGGQVHRRVAHRTGRATALGGLQRALAEVRGALQPTVVHVGLAQAHVGPSHAQQVP